MSVRSRVHKVLEGNRNLAATIVRWFLALLITTNVVAVILETVPSIHAEWGGTFAAFEAFSLAVFTIEYSLRLWSAGEHAHYQGAVGRLRWALTPGALIDLFAFAPAMFLADLRLVRILRVVRIARLVRIAKLSRYSLALRTLRHVVAARMPDLIGLSFVLFVMLILSSALMFHLESEAQPEKFSSIPATMWWGIITLTTIGYGDMAPVTIGGQVLGSVVAILGIGMFALPAGLLGGAFMEEMSRARRSSRERRAAGIPEGTTHCPHCDKPLTED